jgi:hypothetical protein
LSLPDLIKIPNIDKLGVEERVNHFRKRSIKSTAKKTRIASSSKYD